MAAANEQAMDVMLEHMNVLIAGQGKAANKPMATVPNSNTGTASNTTNHWKKVCTNWYGASQCGAQSNMVNLILRLFLYHFLHTMSS